MVRFARCRPIACKRAGDEGVRIRAEESLPPLTPQKPSPANRTLASLPNGHWGRGRQISGRGRRLLNRQRGGRQAASAPTTARTLAGRCWGPGSRAGTPPWARPQLGVPQQGPRHEVIWKNKSDTYERRLPAGYQPDARSAPGTCLIPTKTWATALPICFRARNARRKVAVGTALHPRVRAAPRTDPSMRG